MASLTKEQIFKKIIQNRAYREQILAEERPNFEQIIQQIQKEHLQKLQKQKKKKDKSQEDKKSQQTQGDQLNENLQLEVELKQLFNAIDEKVKSINTGAMQNISSLVLSRSLQLTQYVSPQIQISNESLSFLQKSDNVVAPNFNSPVQMQSQDSQGQANSQIAQMQQQGDQEDTSVNQNLYIEGSSSESTFKLAQLNELNQFNTNVESIQNASDTSSSSLHSIIQTLVTQLNANDNAQIEEGKQEEENQSENDQTK
ncbi:hypothetical protein TTHERM_00703640 (macronuclear) [Tetrahymena thermophila SB210]|uniref:Uncharacterized protein n=1 Tax=Tetrahymena thermophila (strain SB210) TaxID=312017 RepID=Q22GF9_TETTS|nr:hypothetical protein TTHERM_00703640 [Tetrahymena thermophila SB210]EAR84372.3 hypothetical protein TTHERM_00703640 [Tetrahymena thermophila SB210]|eukprot:XP_001032035.3 hypothetical protein TTHERM_00703640 [Tetrahymena thermophila SB210]